MPKMHTHTYRFFFFFLPQTPRQRCCSRAVLPQFSLRSRCVTDIHDDAHDSTDNGIPQRDGFPGECELLGGVGGKGTGEGGCDSHSRRQSLHGAQDHIIT